MKKKYFLLKLGSGLMIILLLSLIFSIYLNNHSIEKYLLEDIKEEALLLSTGLDWTIAQLLSNNKHEFIQRLINQLGAHHKIKNIKLFNTNYRILASNDEQEINQIIRDELVKKIFQEKELKVINENLEENIFEMAIPIYEDNYNSISKSNIKNVLFIRLNISRINNIAYVFNKTVGINNLFVFSFFLLSTIVLFITLIYKPLYKLNIGTNLVAAGQYDKKIEISHNDIFGTLANNFNKMTHKIKIRNEKLTKAKKKAEQSNAAKAKFLVRMSHDIKAPLNSIMGFTSVLLDKKEYDDKKLQIINKSARYLNNLINDVLDNSRINSNKIKFKNEIFSPIEILEDIAGMFDYEKTKDIKFMYIFDNNLPEILRGDVDRIKQIIINLLSNAFKYTNNGNILLKAYYNYDENKLYVKVKDTGIGISKEKQKIIFDSFEKGYEFNKKNFDNKGLGLGLAISKQLTDLMGGDIVLESEKDKGSLFILRLPFKNTRDNKNIEPANDENYQSKIEYEIVFSGDFKLDILIAEDDSLNQELIFEYLKDTDFNLKFVENGLEVLVELKKQKFDFLLLDIAMPVLNGLEAMRKLRSKGNNIYTIATTAYKHQEDINKIIKAGCNNYITKPISKEKLYKAINLAIKSI